MLNLSGSALDPQDGSLAGARLVWSNQKGTLGSGPMLAVANLPARPERRSRLTATNSAGLSASTSITVLVDDDLDLPGPTLAATPVEVGWAIKAGTTQAQTAQLSLANVGGGSLSWSASSSAAWLKLGAASGSAPATLTPHRQPEGLHRGQRPHGDGDVHRDRRGQPAADRRRPCDCAGRQHRVRLAAATAIVGRANVWVPLLRR